MKEKDELIHMIDNGMTTSQIARAKGVSYQAMYNRLNKYGIINPNRSRHKRKSITIPKKREWYEGK